MERALNGFRAGILAYLLEGRQETERAIKFAVWYAERCLHYQLQLYGTKIDALHDNAVSPQTSRGNIRYLGCTPQGVHKRGLGEPPPGQQRISSSENHHLPLGKRRSRRKDRPQPLAED